VIQETIDHVRGWKATSLLSVGILTAHRATATKRQADAGFVPAKDGKRVG